MKRHLSITIPACTTIICLLTIEHLVMICFIYLLINETVDVRYHLVLLFLN